MQRVVPKFEFVLEVWVQRLLETKKIIEFAKGLNTKPLSQNFVKILEKFRIVAFFNIINQSKIK